MANKPKSKSPATHPTQLDRVVLLEDRVDALERCGEREEEIVFDTVHRCISRIEALEEAICPRVAARLAEIEKRVGVRQSNNSFGNLGTFEQAIQTFAERLASLELKSKASFANATTDSIFARLSAIEDGHFILRKR